MFNLILSFSFFSLYEKNAVLYRLLPVDPRNSVQLIGREKENAITYRVILINTGSSSVRIYRPRFRENKPKTLVFSHKKRVFWACFRENRVYNFRHRSASCREMSDLKRKRSRNLFYITRYFTVKTFYNSPNKKEQPF
jgi:hypothetical protein